MKKVKFVVVSTIILMLGHFCNATLIKWKTEDGGNGHYYEAVLVFQGINWDMANSAAMRSGGYLACINSAAENLFVYNLISNNSSFWWRDGNNHGLGPWLGGFQPAGSPEPSGNWSWVLGEPFVYTNWATGEPNNDITGAGISEECLLFFKINADSSLPTWNDIAYTSSLNGYIVEYIPEPCTLLLLGVGGLLIRKR